MDINKLSQNFNNMSLSKKIISFENFIDTKIIINIYQYLKDNRGGNYGTDIEWWTNFLSRYVCCKIKPNEPRPLNILDGDFFFDVHTIFARLLDTNILIEKEGYYYISQNSIFDKKKKRTITDYFEPIKKRKK